MAFTGILRSIKGVLALLILTAVTLTAFAMSPALAHSFNVALIVPLSGAQAAEGQQIRDGFMLATTERDNHPDPESDGHLGGLDVYVNLIDTAGDVPVGIRGITARGKGAVDIIIALVNDPSVTEIRTFADDQQIPLLLPGQTPFANINMAAVKAFITTYEKAYGHAPTAHAARGYNAARRIDVAVREQGEVGDRAALRRSFSDTARGFFW